MKLLKGDIVHAPVLGALEAIPDGALLLDDDGTICEVLHEQPQDFDGEVFDCTGKLIMQSFADMHLHAPQFPNVGTGMDLPLLDWLKTADSRATSSRTAPRACACSPPCIRTQRSC